MAHVPEFDEIPSMPYLLACRDDGMVVTLWSKDAHLRWHRRVDGGPGDASAGGIPYAPIESVPRCGCGCKAPAQVCTCDAGCPSETAHSLATP